MQATWAVAGSASPPSGRKTEPVGGAFTHDAASLRGEIDHRRGPPNASTLCGAGRA